jgi:ankyrin repeat protein
LHVAVFAVAESEDMFECIKVLLEHGADINIENRQCYTPEAMVDQVINEKTIWNDQSEVVKIDDADVINRYEAIRDLFRSPPLHDAVFSGNEKEVNRLLAQGCNPNMINALGNVSLYYAKTPEMVTILCKNGANVNLQNMYGDTPLHDALYRAVSDPGNQEYIECIKALLANNANPSIANEKGDTSVLVAQKVVGGSTIYKGDGTKAAFGEILAQLKAVINPLHYAVMINDELEVKRLLDAKNDPNLKNKFSDTPLHYAKTPGMITLLCENGADVNLQNDAGETPLHIALYGAVSDPGNQKYIECIKALLAKGADPRIANKKSNTSVLVAQKVVGESTIYKGDGTLLRVKHGAQAAFGEILELLSHPTKNASGTSSVPSTAVFGDGASFQTPTKNESGTSSVPSTAAFHKGRTFFQTPTKNESGTSSVPSTAAFHKRRTFFQAPTPKHSGKSRARQTPAQKQSGTSSVRSAAVDGDRTFFQSPTQKQSRTSAARNAAMDGDRTFFQSPTQRQSRTSAARSAAVDGDRTFFQSPTQKYGRTSSARSAAVDGDRAFLQSPTQKYGRTSSARSAAVDGDRAFLQTPTQKHSVKSRTRQTPAPKKSGTNSVPRTAVFSDRPVSRLLNRSANSEEISKPGTSLRDTTAPRALPRWNPTRSMGRNVRVSRGKSLAAGVYKNRYRRRKNQRIVLPVQKRAVPTVSTVNHSGDYGL